MQSVGGVPTVRDRVAQNIVKTYLEPEWESLFEPNSYGFRPNRSCHDAIEQCWIRLNAHPRNRGHKWVLDADIKGCFDNLAHESILKEIGSAPGVGLIEKWMKAGFEYKGTYTPTDEGTPQGGVISPILANIGLHGLENLVKELNPKLGIVRYADDFIITGNREDIEEILPEVKQWLSSRGLELSAEKTKIAHIDEGFNFLGFNVRQYKGKLLIKPQKEKVLDKCKEIGEIIKKYATAKQEVLIQKLNPILRGFANYYQGVVSKEIFSYISHRVCKYLWKWSKRRHPQKGKRWIYDRYFRTINGVKWQFSCETKGRRGNSKLNTLFDIAKHPIIRHIKVKGTASPFDAEMSDYWEDRHKKLGKSRWAKGSKYYQIAKNQQWKCPVCGNVLLNGEEIETHHIVPVKQGGTDDAVNLTHLHKACHKQIHSKSKLKA